jgi:hypothetical protein
VVVHALAALVTMVAGAFAGLDARLALLVAVLTVMLLAERAGTAG